MTFQELATLMKKTPLGVDIWVFLLLCTATKMGITGEEIREAQRRASAK